jgi:membrane protein implicated in regulation of membrane protease activity
MSDKMSALIVDTDKEGVRISGGHCVFIAVCAIIIFAFLYLWIDSFAFDSATGQTYISLKNMSMSILIQLVSVCVLFIFSYFLLRTIYKIKSEKNQKKLAEKVSDITFNKITH